MAQTFQVLRCYKCAAFQVHTIKKANKWVCKLCDEKQSMKRFYSLGTSKECRMHVQTLNGIRGEIEEAKHNALNPIKAPVSPQTPKEEIQQNYISKKSKWEDYLDAPNKIQRSPNEPLNGTEVVEPPKKRYRTAEKSKANKLLSKNNHSATKSKTLESNKPATVIYHHKAKPSNPEVLSPPVKKSKWAEFIEDFELDVPRRYNDDLYQCESNEWFSSLDDKDLDAILDF